MKSACCLPLVVAVLSGCASGNLRESAAADDATANTYRKSNQDNVESYYADIYQKRADEKRKKADSMTVSDEIIESTIDLLLDKTPKENKQTGSSHQ